MTENARSALGFRLSDERRLTLLLFLFSFFVTGMPRVFTSTATHTVLLDSFGAGAMPLAYILQALLIPLIGYFYVRIEGRLKFRTLVLATLVADLCVLAALWGAYQLPGMRWVAYAGIVFFEVEFALVSLMLWGMANQLMTLDQGKRLFGIVGSGEPTALILGGLATPALLAWLKPADLLLMSAIGVGVGLGLTLLILGRFTPQREQESDDAEVAADQTSSAISGWWRAPYLRTLVAVVFVSQLVYFFTDFAFYERANARFPDENELAAFLGTTQALIGVVSLIIGLFISAPLVKRFGIRTGLLVLPLLLVAVCLAVILTGYTIGNGELLFWLIVTGKVIDQSLRYTLDKTSSVTLFQPLPAGKRNGLQAAMESIVEPLSGGIAGVVLYIMAQWAGFTAFGVSHAILVAAVVWALCLLAQHKGYLLALRQALANRGLGGTGLVADDDESVRVLRQGIDCPRAGEALYCIKLLAERGKFSLETLEASLRHPEAEVCKSGIDQAEACGMVGAAPLLRRVIEEQQADPKVLGAALRAYAATGASDAVDLIAPFLSSHSHNVRLDGFAALLRHGGIEGILVAGSPFLALVSSESVENRIFAAQIIERIALPQIHRALGLLLDDPEPAVRTAALRAAAKLKIPEMWPRVLAGLSVPGCEPAAISALAAGGESVLSAIDAFLDAPDASSAEARRHAISAMGLIGGMLAGQSLARRVGSADRALRRVMLRMLNQCRYHCPEAARPAGLAILAEELDQAAVLAAAHVDLTPLDEDTVVGLLRRFLDTEIEQRLESVAHLLGYLSVGGGLDHAWQVIRFSSEADRAYLVEAIDNLLPNALKPAVFALMTIDVRRRNAGLLIALPQARMPAHQRLQSLSTLPSHVITPWLRAASLYACVRNTPAISAAWLDSLPPDGSPIAVELREWARARIPRVAESEAQPC